VLTGFIIGQGATVDQTTGTYDSANAGARTITALLSSSNFTARGSTDFSNYILPAMASGAGTIDPKALTVAIIADPTKIYDGTNTAFLTSADYTLDGFIAGQGAQVDQSKGIYDGVHAGAHNVTTSLSASNYTANSGTLLSNYILPTSASGTGTIDPKQLMASIVGDPTKTYDGNTNAALTSGNFLLDGFVGGEGASVTQTAGSYDAAATGQHTVTASLSPDDFSADTGTLLSDYILPTTASGPGTITAAIPTPPPSVIISLLWGSTQRSYFPFPGSSSLSTVQNNGFGLLPTILFAETADDTEDDNGTVSASSDQSLIHKAGSISVKSSGGPPWQIFLPAPGGSVLPSVGMGSALPSP
jgi:hypothetical protein